MKPQELLYMLDTIDSVADELVTLLALCSVMTLSGSLGAGKTTLTQAILRRCDIDVDVQSPTFNYFNEYANASGETFYHFDLYRMANKEDFLEAGFQEYLYQPKSWALIEWPEIKPRGVKDKAYLVFKKHGKPLHFTKVAELIDKLEYNLPNKKTFLLL